MFAVPKRRAGRKKGTTNKKARGWKRGKRRKSEVISQESKSDVGFWGFWFVTVINIYNMDTWVFELFGILCHSPILKRHTCILICICCDNETINIKAPWVKFGVTISRIPMPSHLESATTCRDDPHAFITEGVRPPPFFGRSVKMEEAWVSADKTKIMINILRGFSSLSECISTHMIRTRPYFWDGKGVPRTGNVQNVLHEL